MRTRASLSASWVGRVSDCVSHRGVSRAILGVVLAASLLGCDAAPQAAQGSGPAVKPDAPQKPAGASAVSAMDGPSDAGSAKAPITPALALDAAALDEKKPRAERTPSVDTRDCEARIAEAERTEPLPGAPKLEKQRALTMARAAKAEPVVFVREPQYLGKKSRMAEIYRKTFLTTSFPRDAVLDIGRTVRGHVPLARDVFLREGYFYADDPGAAEVMPKVLTLGKMFVEPRLWIERGAQRFTVVRNSKHEYEYADGPEKGLQAELLLFDRVGIEGEDFGPSLVLDVRELAHRQGFDRMEIERIGDRHVVAKLRYGRTWVRSLLSRDLANISLECQVVPPEQAVLVAAAREQAYRRAAVLRSLRGAIVEQVRMRLPFDEPKTEVGQQDGELRERFYDAYMKGKREYQFNRDKYPVYDKSGQPLVPQVCIDFITETMERASGMRWAPRGETPKQERGRIDFDELLRDQKRRESALRDYAREHPEQFSLLTVWESEQVRYKKVWQFFRYLRDNMEDYQPGDVVIIRGYAPWDHYQELHTHTFYVYEADPVSGMPMLLAGNSGRPRIVGWDTEMLRAPLRSIRYRIRPNVEWLYDNLVLEEPAAEARWAPPLGVRFPG